MDTFTRTIWNKGKRTEKRKGDGDMMQNRYEDNLMNELAVPFILNKNFNYKEENHDLLNAFYRSTLDKFIDNNSHYLMVKDASYYHVYYDPEFADANKLVEDPHYLQSLTCTKFSSAEDAIYSFQEELRRDVEELGVLERDEEGNDVWTFYLTPVELGIVLDDYDYVQD